MWKTNKHIFFHKFIKPILRPFFFSKNNFKSKIYKLPTSNRPYLILSNHQTTDDPCLLIGSFKDIIYPVTSKDFIPIKLRKLIHEYTGPIYKAKTLKDLGAVKEILQVLREGNNVLIYPEGNRTFSGELCYISDSTIKLIIKTKANICFYNFNGGYGYDPRYSTSKRKGKFNGEIRTIIPYEEIEKMSFEEIKKCVTENLSVIEAPTNNLYKSNNRAEKLERALYRCPICNSINTLESKGNTIICHKCSLEVQYNANLTFSSTNPNFKHITVADWFKEQEDFIRNYEIKKDEIIFEEGNVKLEQLFFDHEVLITNGNLSMNDAYIQVNDYRLNFNEVKEMTVSGKQTLIVYLGNDSYRISSTKVGFNPIKYMQMYYHITNTKLGFKDEFLGI